MDRQRIVVLGGYGHFGGRICRGLTGLGGTELVVAGRSRERSQTFAAELRQTCPGATVRSAMLDRSAQGRSSCLRRLIEASVDTTLPRRFTALMRVWIALGIPAFILTLLLFWLMEFEPGLNWILV